MSPARTVVCAGAREEIQQAALGNGWQVVELVSPSLEDIFVARAGQGRSGMEDWS